MTVEGIRKRIALFSQFDQTMEKLENELKEFNTKSQILFREKQESIKLYGHAFNIAWTLYNAIGICQRYEEEIKNSLLYARYVKNKENAEKFDIIINEILPFIETLMQSLKLEDNEASLDQFADEIDKEQLLSDSNYLAKLKKHLSKNGNKILNIVSFYLKHLNKLLINIKNLRANLSDLDLRFLFEHEYKEYLSTEEWSDLETTFIQHTVDRKYHGSDPTPEQLYEMLSEEFSKIEDMSDTFGVIEPYIDDYDKLAHAIIIREFDTLINTPILDLFRHLGRIDIIKQWIEQLENDELCYEPLENGEQDFCYKEKYNDALSKKSFPKILKLFEGRKTKDWVCFYHVLVCYNYIKCLDFNAFNRWLTDLAGKVLISAGYARVIQMEYWAQKAKYVWSLEEALKYNNSKQQKSKYRDYTSLCDQIREILNKG